MAEQIAGRYDVHSRLGQGAMGEVFLATDTLLRRKVAIKRIRPSHSSESGQIAFERFRREAQVAANVHHPNVVTIYDLVREDDLIYIVMEYVEGRTLSDLIRNGVTLDLSTVAKIGTQVAAALEAAHRVGVIHRDVKPANILLMDASETAKLADFGIARSIGDTSLTGTGLLIGTISFMAPEVANGERATAASDVYSLGSTLFTAIEGHAPFVPPSNDVPPAQILARLLREPAPPAVKAGPLAGLLGRMLTADPSERPSAGEVRITLKELTQQQAFAVSPWVPPDHSTFRGDPQTVHPLNELPETIVPTPAAAGDSPQPAITGGEVLAFVVSTHEPPEVQVSDPHPSRDSSSTDETQLLPNLVETGRGPSLLRASRNGQIPAGQVEELGPESGESALGREEMPDLTSAGANGSRKRRGVMLVGVGLAVVSIAVSGWYALPGFLMPMPPVPVASVTPPTSSSPTTAAATAADPQASARSIAWWRSPVVKSTLEAGSGSWSAAIDGTHRTVYVADIQNRRVQIFDMATQQLVDTVKVPDQRSPYDVAVDSASGTAFLVHSYSGTVSMVDTTTHKILSTIKVGDLPNAIAVDSGRARAYVGGQKTDGSTGQITVIDIPSRSVVDTIPTTSAVRTLQVDPDTHLVHAVGQDYLTIDPVTHKSTSVPIGLNFSGLALDPIGRMAYIANGGDQTISVVDLTTSTVAKTIALNDSVKGIAIDPTSHVGYAWSFLRLYVIDLETSEVLPASVETSASVMGGGVLDVAVPPGGTAIYAVTAGHVAIIGG